MYFHKFKVKVRNLSDLPAFASFLMLEQHLLTLVRLASAYCDPFNLQRLHLHALIKCDVHLCEALVLIWLFVRQVLWLDTKVNDVRATVDCVLTHIMV